MTTSRTGQTTNLGGQPFQKADDYSNSYSVDSLQSDSPQYNNSAYTPEWSRWHGVYRKIPELREVINKLASWTFGRGIEADEKNQKKLDKIKGNGKESPRLVLKNQWRTALICGDSFAHRIPDNQGRMTNLKPLNPETIKVIYNQYGIIDHYEQWIKKDKIHTFNLDEIYHLAYERLGDEKGGIPFPEALEFLINARNEALEDLKILYHRNIKPIMWIEAETDDQVKLNAIESTINEAYKKTENIVISTGVIKEIKNQSTPHYSTLDSLPYVKFLVRQFVTACGMPEVIMGWGAETTEASARIIYLSFQQEIEDMQLYNQEMIKTQLGIDINLEFPASLEAEIKKDGQKESSDATKTKPKAE